MRKIKFGYGYDSNRALVKKLVYNFFRSGRLVTTQKRARIARSLIERLAEKLKEKNPANYNYLLRYLSHRRFINGLYVNVGPVVSKTVGGYVKMEKLTRRISDGAMMVRLSWSVPVVIETNSNRKTNREKPEKLPKSNSPKNK